MIKISGTEEFPGRSCGHAANRYALSEVATSQMCQKLEDPGQVLAAPAGRDESNGGQFRYRPFERQFISLARQRRVDTDVRVGGIRGIQ